MSLIPIDESGQRGRGDETPPRADETDSFFQRVATRARATLRKVGARLTAWRRPQSFDDGPADAGGDGQSGKIIRPDAVRDRLVDDVGDPPECPSIDGLEPRERPLTYPARDSAEENTVDLAVERSDGELTLSVPGEPDTAITSDGWERVEP
jgi:hypothetical protein